MMYQVQTYAAEYNTAYGLTALDAITTGDKNVAIGYQALTAAQTTQDSVVIGVQAGAALTGGSTNIIIGVNALDTATTCDENIAIGAHALGGSLDDATRNVCMGRYTGEVLQQETITLELMMTTLLRLQALRLDHKLLMRYILMHQLSVLVYSKILRCTH